MHGPRFSKYQRLTQIRAALYTPSCYTVYSQSGRVYRGSAGQQRLLHTKGKDHPRVASPSHILNFKACDPVPHTHPHNSIWPSPVVPPAPAGARYPCSLVVSDSGCPARAAGSPAPLHLKAELQPASNQVSRHLVLRRDCEREAGASMVTRRAWRPGSLYSPAHANEL